MPLNNIDLSEISKIVQIELNHNNAKLEDILVTKQEFDELKKIVNRLQDDVASIYSKLDHDYLIRGQEILKIKKHLTLD